MTAPRGTGTSVPVSASVLLADLVDGPDRPLEVLAAFPAAVYLADREDPSRTVAVVARDAAVPPASVVVALPRDRAGLEALAHGASAGIGAGVVRLGPVRLAPTRWFDPRPLPPVGADPVAGAHRLAVLLAAAPPAAVPSAAAHGRAAEELAARIDALRDALDRRSADAAAVAARDLVGIGPGLTPSGDDVLAGLLATTAVLRRGVVAPGPRDALDAVATAVLDAAPVRTTLLSASLLRDAVGGAMASPAARLLSALLAPEERWDPIATRAALAELLALGASSGRDLAEGMLLALRCAASPNVLEPALAAVDPRSPR